MYKAFMNRKKNSYYLKKEDWMLVIPSMLFMIFFLLRYISYNKSIIVWGDEFGYWSGAAYFLGLDWSAICSKNKYYGYGYGIILSPIMKVFGENPVLMKQVSVVMQAFLISSCVYVCYYICKFYYKISNNFASLAIAIASVSYISNIIFVNTNQAEILLTTIVWWNCYCLCKYLLEKKIIYIIFLNILSIYSYSVHSRGIGLICILVFINMFVVFQKGRTSVDKILKFLLVLGFIYCGYLLVKSVRSSYMDAFFAKTNTDMLSMNLETGQYKKLKYLLGREGILSISQNFLGNIYYLMVSTFGIFLFYIWAVIEDIKEWVKKRRMSNVLELFISMTFWVSFAICILFWFGADTRLHPRADSMFYGRYYEYTIGPCIMCGLNKLINMDKKNTKNVFMLSLVLIIILNFVCVENISASGSLSNIWNTCVAVAYFFYRIQNNILAINVITILTVLIIVGISLLIYRRDNQKIFIVALIVCVLWMVNAKGLLEKDVYTWGLKLNNNQIEISQQIENDIEEIYVYEAKYGGIFQFLNVYKSVEILDDIEELNNLEKGDYVITNKDLLNKLEMADLYKQRFSNGAYTLWEKEY